MLSLLTGQPHADHRDEMALAKKPFTVDAHHRAMRHLFVEAGIRLDSGITGDVAAAAVLVAAARAHAEAAKTAPATLDHRSVPGDGDTVR